MELKTGKLPAVHTARRMHAALVFAQHINTWPPPPDSTNWRAAVRAQNGYDWGMYGNDQFGDCVWADPAHGIMLNTANAGKIVVPQLASVLKAYADVTGFSAGPPPENDNGTDENAAIAYLRDVGIEGHKVDDSAPVDPGNIVHVKWSIALFGGLRTGVYVDDIYEQAFESRQPWGANLPNGPADHDVRYVDYDANGVYACTWGRDDQFVPWEKATDRNWCDEAHAELWFDWIRTTGMAPPNLSLQQLADDLRAVGPAGI